MAKTAIRKVKRPINNREKTLAIQTTKGWFFKYQFLQINKRLTEFQFPVPPSKELGS